MVAGNGSTVTLTGTTMQIDASLANTSYKGNSNFYGNFEPLPPPARQQRSPNFP
jgi:hypothetical protein